MPGPALLQCTVITPVLGPIPDRSAEGWKAAFPRGRRIFPRPEMPGKKVAIPRPDGRGSAPSLDLFLYDSGVLYGIARPGPEGKERSIHQPRPRPRPGRPGSARSSFHSPSPRDARTGAWRRRDGPAQVEREHGRRVDASPPESRGEVFPRPAGPGRRTTARRPSASAAPGPVAEPPAAQAAGSDLEGRGAERAPDHEVPAPDRGSPPAPGSGP